MNGSTQPKASLMISGIPLDLDAQRFKRSLLNHGKAVLSEKVDLRFTLTTLSERRVTSAISGLQPELVPWITEVIKSALSDCGYPKFEISAVLARS